MASQDTIPAELLKHVPGILGSIGALWWIHGPWHKRMAMVALGIAASVHGSAYIATTFGMSEGLAGLLIGLFGMSVVDSIFKTWAELGLTPMLREFIRAR